MAHIHKERLIRASAEDVWAALRDWGALHERLAPGFVLDTQLDGDDRIVTFFNGTVVRERLIDLDDQDRRLVWSIVDGPYAHHNGAAQVFAAGRGQARFVWVADLLPNELAEPTGQMMERGIDAVQQALDSKPDAPVPVPAPAGA
jgi:Polyketide cyclase / dehydrase and lipid transport